jgi:hypothetical protein
MTHLKKWPTKSQVREMTGQDIIDAKVQEIIETDSKYQVRETVSTYSGPVSPGVYRALADLVEKLQFEFPTQGYTIDRDLTISRPHTREELEDVAVRDIQSDMYYHPEKYPFTADEISND